MTIQSNCASPIVLGSRLCDDNAGSSNWREGWKATAVSGISEIRLRTLQRRANGNDETFDSNGRMPPARSEREDRAKRERSEGEGVQKVESSAAQTRRVR